jgi:hypothetical protein
MNSFTVLFILLSITAIIPMIIFRNVPLTQQYTYKPTCTQNSDNIITTAVIGNIVNKAGRSCPDNYNTIQVGDNYLSIYPETSTKTNICTQINPNICDTDVVIKDINVVDMSEYDTGEWIPFNKDRCHSLNTNTESKNIWRPLQQTTGINNLSGELCDNLNMNVLPYACQTNHKCKPSGICVLKDTYGNIKKNKDKYLTDFYVSTDTTCKPGYTPSNVTINRGCDTIPASPSYPAMNSNNLMLCRKYN